MLERILKAVVKTKRPSTGKSEEKQAWIERHAGHTEALCLLWPWETKTSDQAWIGGRKIAPRRLMCEMAHGPADGRIAVNTCANGGEGCIHPQHLQWMTYAERLARRIKLQGPASAGAIAKYLE